jgi:hypothetical protein
MLPERVYSLPGGIFCDLSDCEILQQRVFRRRVYRGQEKAEITAPSKEVHVLQLALHGKSHRFCVLFPKM